MALWLRMAFLVTWATGALLMLLLHRELRTNNAQLFESLGRPGPLSGIIPQLRLMKVMFGFGANETATPRFRRLAAAATFFFVAMLALMALTAVSSLQRW